MKSVRIHEHGDSSVLKWESVPEPEIKAGFVIIKLIASSLNHLDIWVRKGIPGVPLPLTTGSDAAGVIVEVGEGVNQFNIGDSVLVQPLIFCGKCKSCQRGEENLCHSMGIMGENSQGVNAELLLIPATQISKFPDSISCLDASAFALVGQTAYQMIVNRAELRKSETIFIWGASSGVGSMGIQIAKAIGAKVIAAAGTSEKCEKALQLGADVVLNYKKDNILNSIKELTNGSGADVVFEHVGASTWDLSIKSLGKGGRIVTCGATTGFKAHINLTHLFFKQQSILGSTMGSKSAFMGIMEMLNKNQVKPVIDKTYHVSDVQAAHDYLENGNQFGKVVLQYD